MEVRGRWAEWRQLKVTPPKEGELMLPSDCWSGRWRLCCLHLTSDQHSKQPTPVIQTQATCYVIHNYEWKRRKVHIASLRRRTSCISMYKGLVTLYKYLFFLAIWRYLLNMTVMNAVKWPYHWFKLCIVPKGNNNSILFSGCATKQNEEITV